MVPSMFAVLERLPLTPNGKIDRRALPAPDAALLEERAPYRAPATPTEKILAEIWTSLIGGASIGVYDNFFALGGDSMSVLRMVARVRQTGRVLSPQQVFQYQTIAELAGLIDSATAPPVELAPATGEDVDCSTPDRATVSLPPGTNGHISNAGESIHLPMTAVVFIPLYPNEAWKIMESYIEGPAILDPEIVRQSIRFLHEFHEALRLRFVRDDVSGHWPHDLESGWTLRLASPHSCDPFLFVDLSDLPAEDQEIRIEEIAALHRSAFDLVEGPVMMLLYFKLGSGRVRLRLLIHHLLVDGYSLPIVLQDLRTVYQQISLREKIHITKTESYRVWAEKMYTRLHSEHIQAEIMSWSSLPWAQVARLPQDYPGETITNSSICLLLASLNPEETNYLLQKVPAFYNMELIDILISTLVLVLARWSGLDLILIAIISHGRDILDDVDVTRTVGCMNTSNRELLHVDTSIDLIDLLNSIKEQRRRMPGRGKLEQWIAHMYWREMPNAWHTSRPHVQFNYEGRVGNKAGNDRELLRSISIPPRKGGEDVRFVQWMTLSCRSYIHGDTFVIRWAYSDLLYKQSTIEGLAQQYISTLRSIIAQVKERSQIYIA
jgi:non-ribosomal peptide synthase protein (TIGR01720 family)